MNDLSPSAQQLVRGAANAARPSAADRQRIFEALRERLGDAALLGHAAAAPSVFSALWVKVSAVTLGLGLAAGGLAVGLHDEPQRVGVVPAPQPLPAVVVPAPVEQSPSDSAASPLPSPSPQLSAAEPPAAAAKRPNDRLAEEVALLSRATSALRAGRANEALKTLGEHQSKFPKGLLSEERLAARAQALCSLGRIPEAERELAKLSPTSPQGARARQLCTARR